jgi:hypothetical protein
VINALTDEMLEQKLTAKRTMKILHLLLLVCAVTVLGGHAAEPTSNPVVALCFVTAADAFTAVQQKLGTSAAQAVSGVDHKRNTLAVSSNHSHAGIVRAFLLGFDKAPSEIRFDATITRHNNATASLPEREEVLSHRIVLTQAARPQGFSVPEEHGSIRVELRATHLYK